MPCRQVPDHLWQQDFSPEAKCSFDLAFLMYSNRGTLQQLVIFTPDVYYRRVHQRLVGFRFRCLEIGCGKDFGSRDDIDAHLKSANHVAGANFDSRWSSIVTAVSKLRH